MLEIKRAFCPTTCRSLDGGGYRTEVYLYTCTFREQYKVCPLSSSDNGPVRLSYDDTATQPCKPMYEWHVIFEAGTHQVGSLKQTNTSAENFKHTAGHRCPTRRTRCCSRYRDSKLSTRSAQLEIIRLLTAGLHKMLRHRCKGRSVKC